LFGHEPVSLAKGNALVTLAACCTPLLKAASPKMGCLEYDWSSHCADGFGLMAIVYEDPSRLAAFSRELKFANPEAFV
jgi:hypothetical protein